MIPKIADFGLVAMTDDVSHTAGAGTLLYSAPETVQSSYTDKVDIYRLALLLLYFVPSLGIILFELFLALNGSTSDHHKRLAITTVFKVLEEPSNRLR